MIKTIFNKLILSLFVLCCLQSCNNMYLGKSLFMEGPTTEINIEKWKSLKIGMTKEEVISLVGSPPFQKIVDGAIYEFWEYEYHASLLSDGPHPKAYVIYFNKDGKVAKMREPAEMVR